jgi:hypothetical protein
METFMKVTAKIHSSKRILLLEVKLKMQNTSKGTPNTMPNHEKDSHVLWFQSCGCYYTWKNGSGTIPDRSPMFW